MLWALATMRHRDRKLVDALARRAQAQLEDFQPQGLANLAYSLGLLRMRQPRLLRAIGQSMTQARFEQLSEQEMAILVYGMALLRHRDAGFLSSVCRSVLQRLPEWQPRGVSCFFYSLGLLGFRQEEFFHQACLQLRGRLPSFNGQDLSNTVYGLALLELDDADFLRALALEATGRLPEFTGQGLGNVVYSFGLLEHPCPALLTAVAQHMPLRFDDMTEQNISNIVFAMGNLCFTSLPLLKALAPMLLQRVHEFTPQGLCITAYGLVMMRLSEDDKPLMRSSVRSSAQKAVRSSGVGGVTVGERVSGWKENGPGLFQTRVHPRKRHRRQVRRGAPSSWQQRAYLVGCHHKSGTELLRHIMMRTFDVLGGMDSCNYNTTGGQLTSFSPMRSDCQLHPARLRYDNHVSGEVIQELRALTQHAGGFRGVLTVRDPLEMVVSAYVYHHRGNEPNTGLGMNIAQMGPEKGVPEMARRMIKTVHYMVDAYKVAPPDMYIIRFEIITNSSKNFNRTIQELHTKHV
ncbi:unnamed protein product [Durusdinium trenchii]